MGIQQTAEDKRLAQAYRDSLAYGNDTATFDAFADAALDPNNPNFVGPGYSRALDQNGNKVLRITDQEAQTQWELNGKPTGDAYEAYQNPNAAPQNPNAPAEDTLSALESAAAQPPPPKTTDPLAGRQLPANSTVSNPAAVALTPANSPAPASPYLAFGAPSQASIDALNRAANPGTGDQNPYTAPGAEAPKVNREAINDVLGSAQSIQSYILGLAGQGRDYSAAEAQLRQATAQATANALGQARSGNRRDRAMLERQAIGEGAFNEQQASRDTALLRAQEEDQNRRFQLETASKAAELGLDVASAMTNIEQIDIGSANNWINNEFQQLGLDKQISADRMKDILGFTRDMAMIQFNYDQLSVEDQNEADKLLMQRYQIDQDTMVALKKIKEDHKFRWGDMLTNMAGGFVSGGLGLLGKALFPSKKAEG